MAEAGPTETDRLLPEPKVRNPRPGYEQRKRVNETGNFVNSDHGTFLSIRGSEGDSVPQDVLMDNPISLALHHCKKQVLIPYTRLLKVVGWQPIYEEAEYRYQRLINVIHPMILVAMIILGYIIQYAACFRRDRAGDGIIVHSSPLETPNATTPNTSSFPDCQRYIISQYIIPDCLHSLAWAFSFYTIRIAETEQLPVLIEKVFLQTSPTESGFLSQGRLIRRLRLVLYGSMVWVVMSQISVILLIIAQYKQYLDFYWLNPPDSDAGRIMLSIFMVLGFLVLDLVYIVVVINYCTQCLLIIFYVKGIQEKIRQKAFELERAMKEINEIQRDMDYLNHHPAWAQSIVMVNFGTMCVTGLVAILDVKENNFTPMMYVSTMIALLLWIFVMLLPLAWAAQLTHTCQSLKQLGHELRMKPFLYQDESNEELDSFLLFTSSIRLEAKLFLIPVKASYLFGIIVFLFGFFLILFQMGVLHVWL